LQGDVQRVVQLLSDICVGHSPAKVLNGRHKHPSSERRSENIYSLKLVRRTVEADGDPEVIDNLAHQYFIWGTSLLEYFALVDSRSLLMFFITETHQGLAQSLPGYPADDRSWSRTWHRAVPHIKHQVTTRQNR
jgi:hypothetical protein